MRILYQTINFTTSFAKHIGAYNKMMCAVACAGNPDFDMGRLLRKNSWKIDEMLVGLDCYQTSPEFIRTFISNSKIKYIKHSDGSFHPNVYLFYNTCTDWTAIVGSSNFTESAFHHNQEMCVEISSSDFEEASAIEQFEKFKSTFDCYGEKVFGFSGKELEDYELKYKEKASKNE